MFTELMGMQLLKWDSPIMAQRKLYMKYINDIKLIVYIYYANWLIGCAAAKQPNE
ncbi:hypothetical protein J22TS3_27380 [Paenibacillus sp. J22TS3]|nr:hypothetical protein J22TS3_27380 [Paenibacillus sp. J22TS3]